MTHDELIIEYCTSLDANEYMIFKEPTLGIRSGNKTAKPDALTINKSWANYEVRAFEIKVKQTDLEQDVKKLKFENYRPWCHRLSFVLGPGVKEESLIPHPVGIIKWTKGGFHTKRSAPRVNPVTDMTKSWDLFHALNMGESRFFKNDRLKQIRTADEWLEIAKHPEKWNQHYRIQIKELEEHVRRAHESQESREEIYKRVRREFIQQLKNTVGIDAWYSVNEAREILKAIVREEYQKADQAVGHKISEIFTNLGIEKTEEVTA